MKKLASIALVAIFATFTLTSCKKDYTCTCTVTGNKTIPDSKKEDAQAACDVYNIAELLAGGTCTLSDE